MSDIPPARQPNDVGDVSGHVSRSQEPGSDGSRWRHEMRTPKRLLLQDILITVVVIVLVLVVVPLLSSLLAELIFPPVLFYEALRAASWIRLIVHLASVMPLCLLAGALLGRYASRYVRRWTMGALIALSSLLFAGELLLGWDILSMWRHSVGDAVYILQKALVYLAPIALVWVGLAIGRIDLKPWAATGSERVDSQPHDDPRPRNQNSGDTTLY